MDEQWEIDVDVKVKDRRAFRRAATSAVEQDDDSLLFPFFAMFIKRWPYSLDPTVPENYDELKTSELGEATKRIEAAFQSLKAKLAG